jgi:hypothetical protein
LAIFETGKRDRGIATLFDEADLLPTDISKASLPVVPVEVGARATRLSSLTIFCPVSPTKRFSFWRSQSKR